MKLKEITAEQLALETGKFLGQARRTPVLVTAADGRRLLIQAVDEDDLLDLAVTAHPKFRASIRRGRRNRSAGEGIPISKLRNNLGL